MKFTILAAAIVLAAAAPSLATTNLVTNGDFATGDYTGWTHTGDTSFDFVSNGVAFFGAVGDISSISQSLATVGGHSYHLSFDLSNGGDAPDSVQVVFGLTTVLSLTDAPPFGTTHYSYDVTVNDNDPLLFNFRNDPDYYGLSNVSVSANVPEAATWAMLIAGFGLVGAASRRRRALTA